MLDIPAKVNAQTNRKIQQFRIGRHLGTDQLDNIHLHVLPLTQLDNTEEAHFSLRLYHPVFEQIQNHIVSQD